MEDIKVVIFDCDGVMFDSTKANTAYYNTILAHFGRGPLTDEQFEFVHMHTVYAALHYLFDNENERKAALSFSATMNYEAFIRYMEMEQDLIPLLDWLKPKIKTAVATNRTTTIGKVLTDYHLDDYFDLVVSALDVPHPKPAPDMLIKVTDHFDIPSTQAVYVGDSQLDGDAAKAAGVPLIAYKNPNLLADYHIDRLLQVRDILNGREVKAAP